ncbi:29650_t:CDS:10 [Gigaspora margarita]|uniref:29650_t:CDS:1 n=1 Tax=Gigaspora margarita TaxID=4874 RepID=A0ABN7W6A8_GIGMA|nr:29650_t:CDS:10 [Gigaspora margarita]
MSDPKVAAFWKKVGLLTNLESQIEITRAEGMLQSARATTDGVVPAVDLKSGEQNTKLDFLFEYTPLDSSSAYTPSTRLDSSSAYTRSTRLDSSSEYIPSDKSEEDDEFEFITVRCKKPKKSKLKSNELPHSPSPQQSPIDNQLRINDFITGENSKMVGNYARDKITRPLEAEDDNVRYYKRTRGQDNQIEIEELPIEEPSLNKIAQEQNNEEEERVLKRYHQGGNTSPSFRPSCVIDNKGDTTDTAIDYNDELDHQGGNTHPPSRPSCVVCSIFKSDTIDETTDTAIDYNDELDKLAKETTLQSNGEWIIGTNKVNVRDLLTLWQNEKKRPHNDLAYYDIIDITPGTNSDFVKKRSKDEFDEIMKYGSPIPDINNSDIKELIVEMVKEPDFQKARKNDLLNENLSERMYREVFFTPIMQSLFQKLREDMKISLFASAEDFDLIKNDEEDRSSGRKIDIVWTTSPKIEFAIGEVSGPPNRRHHPHFFGDKLKIAKMLKVMLNRIVRIIGGVGESLSLLKLYGLQIYDHTAFVYEMTVPYKGLYVFREVQRFQLPTNRNNVVLLCRSVLKFLLFKEMLIQSLNNLNAYIMKAGLHTPTKNDSASLFVTQMSYTPKK